MKAYTSIPQAEKIISLGIDPNTADWSYYGSAHNNNGEHPIQLCKGDGENDIPCWSLAALLAILPFHLIINNQRYTFSMIKGLDRNGETYAIKYAIYNTTFYLHLTAYYNNPVDACYEMILKLHKLNLL